MKKEIPSIKQPAIYTNERAQTGMNRNQPVLLKSKLAGVPPQPLSHQNAHMRAAPAAFNSRAGANAMQPKMSQAMPEHISRAQNPIREAHSHAQPKLAVKPSLPQSVPHANAGRLKKCCDKCSCGNSNRHGTAGARAPVAPHRHAIAQMRPAVSPNARSVAVNSQRLQAVQPKVNPGRVAVRPGVFSSPAFRSSTVQLSHGKAQMCAKVQWGYKTKDGVKKQGTTGEACGGTYNKSHDGSPAQAQSGKDACNAAWSGLPKLTPGETWEYRSCTKWQKSLGG